ncbi:DUF4184 family protein [Lacisediminihabitans profunda]|uniref:DUF4184 family protein n=1 Tax=Lacisediminihabitans profunda TaxID=2594790 RepID=A0A5C8UTD1_9MICO|nr:DUF4184 family protein [Lacisediminihabitans profunda]TXN31542.1 DUF4184 family protein [Lacisediminihabitans profunda]
MPFTPSHIAAVLPFVRLPLASAALVIGSMVPDLPFFVPLGLHREQTHSLAGILPFDLPLAIACLLLWFFVVRAPLLDFAPAWLRRRMPPSAALPSAWTARLRVALVVLVSVLLGTVTHLIWDSFTHSDGWAVLRIGLLREHLGPFAVYRWAQYASSIAGLAIVAGWAARWARVTPLHASPTTRVADRWRVTAWIVVAAVVAAIALGILVGGVVSGAGAFDRTVLHWSVTRSLSVGGLIVALACLAWHLLPRGVRPTAETSEGVR